MILLDTHVLVWVTMGDEQLSSSARDRIDQMNAAGDVRVSPISAWEAAMLERKDRIALGQPVGSWWQSMYDRSGFQLAPITPAIALDAGSLQDSVHGDPCDRLLIATARSLAIPILTSDRLILIYADAGLLQAIDARR